MGKQSSGLGLVIALEMVKHYDDTLMLKGSKNSKQSCWWGLGCRVDKSV
ncbi:hypothetical protein [Aggregatibacter actinomycetemcomitans]|nr:hypothetical protein [Aggregatibacter actinomycetemcomitans]